MKGTNCLQKKKPEAVILVIEEGKIEDLGK